MKKLFLVIVLLAALNISFAQSLDQSVKAINKKPSALCVALKINPLCILYQPSQWYQFNIEASIPKVPRTSIIVSFGKNFRTDVNLKSQDVYDVTSTLAMYTYNASTLRSKTGYTNEMGLRHYIPLHKNSFAIEGLYVGAFYSMRNSLCYVKEEYLDIHYHFGPTYFNGGNISVKRYAKFYGAELGYQKVFGKKKQFIINVNAGYGKEVLTYNLSSTSLMGPGLSQTFDNTNKMAFKENIAIGMFMQ
ncbi:MAG: hypothetical protein RL138_940 [Bacteroidota bacterium]